MKERDGKGDGQTEEEGLNQTESVCPVSKNVEKGNGNSTSSWSAPFGVGYEQEVQEMARLLHLHKTIEEIKEGSDFTHAQWD